MLAYVHAHERLHFVVHRSIGIGIIHQFTSLLYIIVIDMLVLSNQNEAHMDARAGW